MTRQKVTRQDLLVQDLTIRESVTTNQGMNILTGPTVPPRPWKLNSNAMAEVCTSSNPIS